jgi:hypothetical protein
MSGRFSIPETASISGSSRRCSTVRAPNPEDFLPWNRFSIGRKQSMFQNLSLGIEGFLGRWRITTFSVSRLGGQKEPLYPVILLATHTGTLIFSGFFWARVGSEEQTAITEVFEHPPCPRPRSVTEKRLQRFNWTRADALESIPVALQSRFSALRISST